MTPAHAAPQPLEQRAIHIRPPNSVWELAHSRQVARPWPPVSPTGRQHVPLGPWFDPAADAAWAAA